MDDERAPTKRLRPHDAVAVDTHDHAPGERVGNWVIGTRLGGGGFGDVFAAHHHDTHQPAALKILRAKFTASSEMLARFDREVEVLSRLSHPNIVQVIDAGFDQSGRPYLCMERLIGQDLGAMLEAKHRIDLAELLEIFEALCDAVGFAHEVGIVHRDLKASNVFVCQPSRRVVLLDFGIAKLSDALAPELTASHQSLGTPGCMAPEQIHGTNVDARTDIYALGNLMFHALTGRMPFRDPSETMTQYLHVHARRPRASALVEVPAGIDDVIIRAMAIEPSHRFETAAAFLAAARMAAREGEIRAGLSTVERTAIFLMVEHGGSGYELDESLITDVEAVLPAAERILGEHGFSLVVDLGTSALFIGPTHESALAVETARATWDALQSRPGRDPRVRIGICVHRGLATIAGTRVEPCALVRPETWGMPNPLEGLWVTAAIEPVARRLC